MAAMDNATIGASDPALKAPQKWGGNWGSWFFRSPAPIVGSLDSDCMTACAAVRTPLGQSFAAASNGCCGMEAKPLMTLVDDDNSPLLPSWQSMTTRTAEAWSLKLQK